MLTLLKQARAFGVGIVLATQNPVDLDYKGLSNTGTWFLGRLQTERDKARVLDGLESASGETGTHFDRSEMAKILSGLGSRKFLLHNVHETHPVVFQTRWALSYLRGPLTRNQIAELMKEQKAELQQARPQGRQQKSAENEQASASSIEGMTLAKIPPALSDSIIQRYLAISKPLPGGSRLVYQPSLLGLAKVHYVHSKADIDLWREAALLVPEYQDATIDVWEDCDIHWSPELEFDSAADGSGYFVELPGDFSKYSKFRSWRKQLRDFIYRDVTLPLWSCDLVDFFSEQDETAAGFRMRVLQLLREESDLRVEKLKAKYESKFQTARDRVQRAEERVKREEAQYQEKSYSSFVSIGSSILGALLGRKVVSKTNISKGTTAMRSYGRASKEKADIKLAKEKLLIAQEKYEKLEDDFEEEVEKIEMKIDPEELEIESCPIRPRKTDINVADVALLWMPFAVDPSGDREPLFEMMGE